MHSTSTLENHIQRHHKKEYESIMFDRGNKLLKLHTEISNGMQTNFTTFLESSSTEYQECLLH